jgi:hypothetical protein
MTIDFNALNNLKMAVVNQPELLATINELDENRHRLAKLIFDLGRLDEALVQRVIMFEGIKVDSLLLNGGLGDSVSSIANNCQQLLITISSFINMASSIPADRANAATEEFNDLMKRM